MKIRDFLDITFILCGSLALFISVFVAETDLQRIQFLLWTILFGQGINRE